VNPEQLTRTPPFSLLPEAGTLGHGPGVEEQLPDISRGGINLYSPAQHCPDYLALLCTEMTLRGPRFTTRGSVASLWFRGYPLRQLAAEDLTELVFRLSNRFNLHHNRGCDRGIHLGPEHCTRDNLALLKGLGFEVIRVILDATLAGPDSGITPFQRAIATVGEFAGMRLQATINYSTDTSEVYLSKALATLAAAQAEDIDLEACLPPVIGSQHLNHCQRLFFHTEATLLEAGYELFGDRSFKIIGHPHRLLRENSRLAYGPWGFYHSDISQWLGLGLGAEGLLDGYFYRNTHNPADYQERLHARLATEISWSTIPISQQPLYHLIQQLFCYHQMPDTALISISTREVLIQKGWLIHDGGLLRLTPLGKHNLQHLMRLIIQGADNDQN